MKPPKYFNQFRTKPELLRAVKYAEANEKFFNQETQRFFGRQKLSIAETYLGPMLKIRFTQKHARTTFYKIEPDTLKLNHIDPIWLEVRS